MPFNLLFMDSVDHYTTPFIGQKYAGGSPDMSVETTGVNARTGLGCFSLVSQGGPTTRSLGLQPNLICGHAVKPGVYQGTLMLWIQAAAGDNACFVQINPDASLSVINHSPTQHGPTLLTTPPNLVQTGVYAYIEYAIIFALLGSVYVRVNGVLVGSATGVPTVHTSNVHNYCDTVSLSGPNADVVSVHYHDDIYIGYSDDPANIATEFQGAVRLYPYIPSANKGVVWTPLANTNWQETSQIPPPGDTAYVFSPSVGDIDQYQMAPVAGHGPVGSFNNAFGQITLSEKIDAAGSAQVAPDVAGNVGTADALTTSYTMHTHPYLLNPATGLRWTDADLATTFMGPKVTA